MSLTEIARFANLVEAQVAASRLRAEGMEVLLQNEHWGASDYLMSIAMGGFRLWTPSVHADQARNLLAELHDAPSEPLAASTPDLAPRGGGVAKAGAALTLATLLGPAAGLLLAGRRRIGAIVALLCLAAGLSLWLYAIFG